jgi:hypothetical protein
MLRGFSDWEPVARMTAWYKDRSSFTEMSEPIVMLARRRMFGLERWLWREDSTALVSLLSGATPYRTRPYGDGSDSSRSTCARGIRVATLYAA